MSGEWKQQKAVELRKEGWTQQRIADVLGVSQSTIRDWLRDISTSTNTNIELPATITDSLGRERPTSYQRETKKPTPPPIFASSAKAENKAHKDIESIGVERLAEKLATGEAKTLTDAKRQDVREKVKDMPTLEGKHRVIYADPPWQYRNNADKNYSDQDKHYPTMTIDELCAMPVSDIAEDNAVLFMWSTSTILEAPSTYYLKSIFKNC